MPTREELKTLQALPLKVKIRKTQQRIREWVEYYGEDGVYISFSGGKDSTVLLDMVRKLYPNIEAVFVNTGLEYPEIVEFVRTFDNIIILRPNKNFRQVLTEYGYPIISKIVSHNAGIVQRNPEGRVRKNIFAPEKKGMYAMYKWMWLTKAPFRVSDKCCNYIKKNPSRDYERRNGKMPIMATMAEEGKLRETKWLKDGCNSFNTKYPNSAPMSFWRENDVLEYVKTYNIKIADVYGDIAIDNFIDEDNVEGQIDIRDILCDYEGCKFRTTGCNRTGCMFCLFGAHLEKEEGRLERMKLTHPKRYKYVMGGGEFDREGMWVPNSQGLGFKFVIDWLNENGNLHIKY